jgi:hypothetical protein
MKITVRHIERHGQTGWEAITLATVPTTHVIGLRPTATEVVNVLLAQGETMDRIEVQWGDQTPEGWDHPDADLWLQTEAKV